MIGRSTPHPVPLPLGEGRCFKRRVPFGRPFSHGEKDRMRGDALDHCGMLKLNKPYVRMGLRYRPWPRLQHAAPP